MIKTVTVVVVTAAILAVSGCSGDTPANLGQSPPSAPAVGTLASSDQAAGAPAGDKAAICARWKAAQLPYLLNTAPEAKAWSQAIADSYQGKTIANAAAIQHTYFAALADATRPLVTQAADPELRTALTQQVAELDRLAAATTADFAQGPVALARTLEVCR